MHLAFIAPLECHWVAIAYFAKLARHHIDFLAFHHSLRLRGKGEPVGNAALLNGVPFFAKVNVCSAVN